MGLATAVFALIVVAIVVANIAAFIQGLILTFRASVLLGIICFIIHIPFYLFGWVYWVTKVDIAKRIQQAFPDVFSF